MKKIFFAILCCFIAMAAAAQSKNFIDQPYLEINSTADTLVEPDEIFIKITLSESDTKDKISLQDMETKMVDGLKSLGIATDKDLTTSDISSNFKNYFLRGKDIIKTKDYTLKVSSAVMATRVFILLESLGISNASIDSVDYSQKDLVKNEMRTRAIMHARESAEALVKPLHQQIGPAIYISDMQTTPLYMRMNAAKIDIAATGENQNGGQSLPDISFEKIKISATVNVNFVLKQ